MGMIHDNNISFQVRLNTIDGTGVVCEAWYLCGEVQLLTFVLIHGYYFSYAKGMIKYLLH